MRRVGSVALVSLLLVGLGCGSGSNPRILQSISLTSSPAGDNAIQFTATGHYNQDPMTMSPLPAFWGIFLLLGTQGQPTITQDGLAQCTAGGSGTYEIAAYAPADPSIPISQLLEAKKIVVAYTQITCP